MASTSIATKRAVGYLRVSTPGQAGERHSSLETQEARFREYCLRHDLIAITTFTDVVSGRRDDRKEYLQMVEYVQAGNAEVIIVQFLDRFGRNPKEILRRYWHLQDQGISVIATDEDLTEELLLLVRAGIAGAESTRNSERMRANMRRAIEKGSHAARSPFGIKKVYQGRNSHWEIDPVQAPVVREMYRLAVEENLGYKAIADRVSEQGHRSNEGRAFASYSVQRILNNEAIMGTLAYGKRPKKGNPQQEVVRVPNIFPPILSQQEWDRLQERLAIRREASRGRTHASAYLLSGMIRCGNCRGPMVGKSGSMWRGQRYRNYYCSRAMSSRALCSTYNGHSAQKLEKAILEYLSQFSDPKLVRKHLQTARAKDLEQKETELAEARRGLAHLDSEFQKHLDLLKRDIINEEEFNKANLSIREERTALKANCQELEGWLRNQETKASSAERIPVEIKSFLEDFQGLDIRIQKARLQTILKSAYVHRDRRIEVEFRG